VTSISGARPRAKIQAPILAPAGGQFAPARRPDISLNRFAAWCHSLVAGPLGR
jgi:hypothetical protein